MVKADIFEAKKLLWLNFQGLLRIHSPVNPKILVEKSLTVVEKLYFVQ